MKYLFVFFMFLMCFPLLAQDESNLYKTADGKFQFVIPQNWEVMKETNERITLIYVGDGDISPYTLMSIGFADFAPTFEDDADAVKFMFGEKGNAGEFEREQIGDYPVLIRENDDEEADTLFAIILIDDGIVGALQLNEQDFSADLKVLRPIVDSIIASVKYNEVEEDTLADLALITPNTTDLTNRYEAESGLFAFNYPEDWMIELLETDLVLLGTPDLTPTSTPDLGIQIYVSENPEWLNPNDILQTVLTNMMDYVESSDLAIIENLNLNGRPAAIVRDKLSSRGLVLLALRVDDNHFAMLNGIPSHYDPKEAETIVMAVASTVEITKPQPETVDIDTSDLTETAILHDGLLTFHYPEGWVLEESDALIKLYSAPEEDENIGDGQIHLIINVFQKSTEEGLTANSTLVEVAESIQSPDRLKDTPPTELILNGSPAVIMSMGISGMDGWVVYVEYDYNVVVQVMAFANEGDFESYRETVLGIASTVAIK